MNTEFYEMDEPEIEEEFLQFITSAIESIEYLNMWNVPFKSFRNIEFECKQLLRDIANYEKRIDYEFPCFREFELRIAKQQERCRQMKFKAGYRQQ